MNKEEMEKRMQKITSCSHNRGGFANMIHFILAQTLNEKSDKIKSTKFRMNDKLFMNEMLSRPSYNESINILISVKFIKRITRGFYEIDESFKYFMDEDFVSVFREDFK
jgi:hypothetical protein